MARREKREAAIRRNTRQVRFDDLDAVLRAHDFDGDADAHHVVYSHRRHGDIVTNVPKPHGGATHVKPIYVGKAIAAIDEADRRDTDQETE